MALEAAGYCEQLRLDPAVLTLVLRLQALMASFGLQRGLSLDQVNQKFACFTRTKVQINTDAKHLRAGVRAADSVERVVVA